MKTRKILALVMAIALLAVSMTIVASAEEAERPTSVYSITKQPRLFQCSSFNGQFYDRKTRTRGAPP
jgi:hypothetical protein